MREEHFLHRLFGEVGKCDLWRWSSTYSKHPFQPSSGTSGTHTHTQHSATEHCQFIITLHLHTSLQQVWLHSTQLSRANSQPRTGTHEKAFLSVGWNSLLFWRRHWTQLQLFCCQKKALCGTRLHPIAKHHCYEISARRIFTHGENRYWRNGIFFITYLHKSQRSFHILCKHNNFFFQLSLYLPTWWRTLLNRKDHLITFLMEQKTSAYTHTNNGNNVAGISVILSKWLLHYHQRHTKQLCEQESSLCIYFWQYPLGPMTSLIRINRTVLSIWSPSLPCSTGVLHGLVKIYSLL